MKRRRFLQTALAAGFGAAISGTTTNANGAAASGSTSSNGETSAASGKKPPIVLHQTDLFHPHCDPDDHFDLATVYSLAAQGLIDLRGLILDYPPVGFGGDPAACAVAQMNRITRKTIPFAVGSSVQTSKRGDALPNLAPSDSGAVALLIETLRNADAPVRISVVGSANDVAIAAAREPELFREKCAGVYLNAGSARPNPDAPERLEYNVQLNPSAYASAFDLPCPLYWFPCWDVEERWESSENGAFYWLEHAAAFEGVSDALAGYFAYMFEESRDPRWLKAIETAPSAESWGKILAGKRAMWATASLLLLADKTVLKSGEIVDATPDVVSSADVAFRMENVRVSCDDAGRTSWAYRDAGEESNRKILRVLDVAAYPTALARAINALFRTLG